MQNLSIFNGFCCRKSLTKVLIKLFQKFAGSWGRAPSRARRREMSKLPFFGSFLRLLRQKRTERITST